MENIKFHQGDVIGASMNVRIPFNSVAIRNKPIALSELSGHMHVITGDVELFTLDNRLFVLVGEGEGRLQHINKSIDMYVRTSSSKCC